jgi:hypothetical protein
MLICVHRDTRPESSVSLTRRKHYVVKMNILAKKSARPDLITGEVKCKVAENPILDLRPLLYYILFFHVQISCFFISNTIGDHSNSA